MSRVQDALRESKRRTKNSGPLESESNALIYWADIEAHNKEIKQWADGCLVALRNQAMLLTGRAKHDVLKYFRKTIKGYQGSKFLTQALSNSLHRNVYKRKGLEWIDRVGFGFSSHGIFIAKGIYGKEKGMKRNVRGNPDKNNPRAKINWFNSVMESRIQELADIVAKYDANAVVNSSRILIS